MSHFCVIIVLSLVLQQKLNTSACLPPVPMTQRHTCFSVSPAQQVKLRLSSSEATTFGLSACYLQANYSCFYFQSIFFPGNLKVLLMKAVIAGKPDAGD